MHSNPHWTRVWVLCIRKWPGRPSNALRAFPSQGKGEKALRSWGLSVSLLWGGLRMFQISRHNRARIWLLSLLRDEKKEVGWPWVVLVVRRSSSKGFEGPVVYLRPSVLIWVQNQVCFTGRTFISAVPDGRLHPFCARDGILRARNALAPAAIIQCATPAPPKLIKRGKYILPFQVSDSMSYSTLLIAKT